MNFSNKALLLILSLSTRNAYTKNPLDEEIKEPQTSQQDKDKKIEFKISKKDRKVALDEYDKQSQEEEDEQENRKYSLKEFTEEEKILFAEVLASAPMRLQNIIESIARNEQGSEEFKQILLAGPSGSGKSTLAEAIAYKLKRKCLLVDGPSLLSHYRDQAVENLNDLFEELEKYNEKPVLIINEVNVLTDNHTSEHSDTKDTAAQLWCKLDKLKNSNDFLFIGTTNITKKMPHQLQSRFRGSTFIIDMPDAKSRRSLLKRHLQKVGLEMDSSFTEEYFDELVQKTASFSHRDLESLIKIAFSFISPNDERKTISRYLFDQAYDEYKNQTENLWDFTDPATDDERRHRENLDQQKKFYEDNKELQLKTTELNLLFQALLATQTSSNNTPTTSQAIAQFHKAVSIIFPDRKLQGKLELKKSTFSSWYEVTK